MIDESCLEVASVDSIEDVTGMMQEIPTIAITEETNNDEEMHQTEKAENSSDEDKDGAEETNASLEEVKQGTVTFPFTSICSLQPFPEL